MREGYLISIDPSLSATGVAIMLGDDVITHTVIKTHPKNTYAQRLMFICSAIQKILEEYDCPDLAIESQYISMRSPSALKVIEVKGLIVGLFLLQKNIRNQTYRVIDIAPSEARKFIGVKGRHKRKESKALVGAIIRGKYPLLNIEQDVVDAIAVGLTAQKKKFFLS